MGIHELQALHQAGGAGITPGVGLVPGGSSLAASRVQGVPGSAGFDAFEGLGMSPELLEEMAETVEAGTPIAASPQAVQPAQGRQSQAQLVDDLATLQHQWQQQSAAGDASASHTMARMQEIGSQLNARFESQAGGDEATGEPPAALGTTAGGGTASSGEVAVPPGGAASRMTAESARKGPSAARKLATIAIHNATDGKGDGHHCYKDVTEDLAKIGVHVSGSSAYQAANQLAHNSKVRELKGISAGQLPKLPAGAIVVWNKCKGHPYGHISIATGDGREASDVMRKQITNYGPSFRVFLPKG